ncbi:LytTR family DNA-binding domain-containing protein [Agriterribacter sp.]|uniref:LytTR family DNA-binding domain-containing protein n=1 Tax=Agriterribacter sp. TaxID=2821509 RepID=UPI002D0AA41F|nr:LytTR family DNA-binding domain-containing protein [Agriterribacter sp.]HRP56267.1 LytTR family DNA-binding domain-containing protein [Agriterribacter sp.]
MFCKRAGFKINGPACSFWALFINRRVALATRSGKFKINGYGMYAFEFPLFARQCYGLETRENEQESFIFILTGENHGNRLEVAEYSLLAVQALDNYVNIFWEEAGCLQTTMLRNTLTNIVEQLNAVSGIYRSHRGWLVNTRRVNQVEGNAQGLRLSVDLMQQQVPVSRGNITGYRRLAENQNMVAEAAV